MARSLQEVMDNVFVDPITLDMKLERLEADTGFSVRELLNILEEKLEEVNERFSC